MDFDEIKNKWNQENSGNIQIPGSVSQLRKAQHPIDKLKRNMKFELIIQVATLVILPVYFGNRFSNELHDLLLGVYAVFVLICLYYLYNFYKFYKQSVAYSTDSRDSLYDLYYNLRLNMERYKSLGFLILPFIMILVAIGSIENAETTSLGWTQLLDNFKSFLISMVLVAAIYIGAVIVWVDRLYGRYAKQIKDVLNELKEENENKE